MSHVLTHPLWGSPTLPESHSGPFRAQKIFRMTKMNRHQLALVT